MIQGKWFAPGEDISAEVLPIREKVFGVSGPSEDPLSWNALVYTDSLPVAAGRIWWENGAYRIGDIGVLPEFRGKRLGDLVLRLLLFKAQSHAAREVRLFCPEDTAGFFSRLGFTEVSGSRSGNNVEMMVSGSDINLDYCASCKKEGCPNRKG